MTSRDMVTEFSSKLQNPLSQQMAAKLEYLLEQARADERERCAKALTSTEWSDQHLESHWNRVAAAFLRCLK